MKYVGLKQVLKAIETKDITKVYIGKDAEKHIIDEIMDTCNGKNVEIIEIETMAELGKMAGIEVKAATAAE